LKAGDQQFDIRSARLNIGKRWSRPGDRREQRNRGQVILSDLPARGLSTNLSPIIDQANIPRRQTILLGRKDRNDNPLERPRRQLDRHLPNLTLPKLARRQFKQPIETGAIVEHLKNNRKEAALP